MDATGPWRIDGRASRRPQIDALLDRPRCFGAEDCTFLVDDPMFPVATGTHACTSAR